MPSERPQPTFKDILASIKRIIDEGQGRQSAPSRPRVMAIFVLIALVLAVVVTVKFLKQN